MVYGSYVDANVDTGETGGGTTAHGRSWQTSVRYSLPLLDINKYRHELALGFDFKRANNDVLFGGSIPQTSDVDVAQFALGYTGLVPDQWGRTSIGVELYYSPGGLSKNNDDVSFNNLRPNSKSQYVYLRANAERITRLPWNFSWMVRGWVQWANKRLQPSEELALGGYNTIRGYAERVHLGDNGGIINNEIRSPSFPLGLFALEDQLQLLAFFDWGRATAIDPQASDGNLFDRTLYSTGVGARYTVSRNFSLRFDYGIPLTDKGINGGHDSLVDFGAILSF
jgi:hemolysin activation/secretion protein